MEAEQLRMKAPGHVFVVDGEPRPTGNLWHPGALSRRGWHAQVPAHRSSDDVADLRVAGDGRPLAGVIMDPDFVPAALAQEATSRARRCRMGAVHFIRQTVTLPVPRVSCGHGLRRACIRARG